MRDANDACTKSHPILAPAAASEAFAAIADPESDAGCDILRAIAGKIGATRRPGVQSSIPAGSTYLAQFVTHDIDFRSPEDPSGAPRLDLALIYGDGPRHDAFAYQVPSGAGEQRSLLRLGRARPSDTSPAWGAARDLPRAACPHLDAHGVESKSEVLVPNTLSDSNLILGQVQTLWAMLHNAVHSGLNAHATAPETFERARRITRHIYRNAVINDVLGAWMLRPLRARYVRPEPDRLSKAPLDALPAAYMSGVARIGHGLVREIYALNAQRPLEGLRGLLRHTSSGRPDDMPLTEDWLLDFALFFDIGDRKAQRARGIGPHVARPFALGGGVGLDAPSMRDGLVLRDLVACTRGAADIRGAMPTVRTLVDRIEKASPGLLKGCFAQDESRWRKKVANWLADVTLPDVRMSGGAVVKGARLPEDVVRKLASDPPLSLFLMLEGEADANGETLGGLGSILLAETLTGALPAPAPAQDLEIARTSVFRGQIPTRMADVIVFLQRHYRFADGARLHPTDIDHAQPAVPPKAKSSEIPMLDDQTSKKPAAGLVEVADYIELGRLVVDWTNNASARPANVGELRTQLDGIASVPDTFTGVEFVEGRAEVLVIRLPEAGVTQQTMDHMQSLRLGDRYMLPKFYDDLYHKHFGPVMTPLDTFLARIGDYTIAQCR